MGKRIMIEAAGDQEEEIVFAAVCAAIKAFEKNPMGTYFAMNQETFSGENAMVSQKELKVPSFLIQSRYMSGQEQEMRESLYRQRGAENE